MEMHANGIAALGEYFVEAERTDAMWAGCTAEPLNFKECFKHVSGVVEHDAHLAYLGIKSRLYAAARLGYGFSN
jgi:hypothetical protein